MFVKKGVEDLQTSSSTMTHMKTYENPKKAREGRLVILTQRVSRGRKDGSWSTWFLFGESFEMSENQKHISCRVPKKKHYQDFLKISLSCEEVRKLLHSGVLRDVWEQYLTMLQCRSCI